jgi:hypothetical protein
VKTIGLIPKVYPLVIEAIEAGVKSGYQRAFKHTEQASQADITEHITDAIVGALCERFHIEEPDTGGLDG